MPKIIPQIITEMKGAYDASTLAFYAGIDHVAQNNPVIARAILQEFVDQTHHLKLIASENYSSLAVQYAMGNLLTDKYAEGFPHHRFYAGCENIDVIESEAARLACELFAADHAFVQPHSGADANLVAFLAILSHKVQKPLVDVMEEKNLTKMARADWNKIREKFMNQKLLALDYYSGGHLTHGYRYNFSGTLFDAYYYAVDKETNLIDMDQLRTQLHEVKPLILLAGYSAYPRKINFAKMRELADEVGAVLMVDMAHFAGLVAGGVFTGEYNPIPYAHVVTSTTHKTLRGPRGGIVLCQQEFAEAVDKACPIVLGGPLPHVMAAKAVAFKEALSDSFKKYAHAIVKNSQAFAQAFQDLGMKILTNGTDNHLMLLDVSPLGLTGRQAESALRECDITMNRNALPFDVNGPWYTSGLRIGTPAITTRGMGVAEVKEIAAIIVDVLKNTKPTADSRAKYDLPTDVKTRAIERVRRITRQYPIYPNLKIETVEGFLKQI
ncbi:MAG: glycine hydroxymethyltransferase [Lactobacillales bacterium]|jgi:glycine hydroxymethyltransferase|nr:glycine hydroxymethyltransferase [Lactobacillales bacterium]